MIAKLKETYLFIFVAVLYFNVVGVHSLVEGLYCGTEDCYDGMQIT